MGGYRELKVWQLGIEISLEVYRVTDSFPQREIYGLTSQLRRAAISISANIADGHARTLTKDLMRFLSIARGSLVEVETQLVIAERLGYVPRHNCEPLRKMHEDESRMLAGLRRSLNAKLRKIL